MIVATDDEDSDFEPVYDRVTKRDMPDFKDDGDDFVPTRGLKKMAIEDDAVVERGCIDPWLGNVIEPSNAPKNNPAAPEEDLEIEWAYGYRGFDSRLNLVYNSKGEMVYPTAGLVVMYDRKTHTQSHFTGHTDDVVCLAQNPANIDIVASGQVATIDDSKRSVDPHICIFDSTDPSQVWKIPNAHKRAVRTLAFSRDGKYLASVGEDDRHTIKVWDWKNQSLLAEMKGDTNEIYHICWSNKKDGEFTTVGNKHVYFWTFSGSSLTKKKGQLQGKYPWQRFYSVAYSESGYACVGNYSGEIYVFVGCRVRKAFSGFHAEKGKGKVFCIATHENGLVSGGSDKKVNIFNSKMQLLKQLSFPGKVKSVHIRGNDLLVGTSWSSIYEVRDFMGNASGMNPVTKGHWAGELWPIAFSPDASKFVTAGEDNKVLLWDVASHSLLKEVVISTKKGRLNKRYSRAATTSPYPPNKMARAIDWSPDGSHIIIGRNDGCVVVFDGETLDKVAMVDLNKYGKQKVTNKSENWMQTIKYSPSGKTVAVGTHGMVIVLLETSGYNVEKVLKTHNASLYHMDWSKDGTSLQSNCGAYELLFHDIDEDNLKNSTFNSSASSLKDVEWATQNCIFGWPVQGIWEGLDYSDINTVDANQEKSLLAIGDDWGRVQLMRYPALKFNKRKSHYGHASHVVNVRFTPDGSRLFTTGGGDRTVIQWKVTK